MKRSKLKLLLNAEPFGFGPAAAIASFFPHLRKRFEYIGYIGKGHTLDLQRDLEYDAVHDSGDTSVFSKYNIFLTALDFEMAGLAKMAGLKVIIYDPLTWYWKTIQPVVAKSDLYLAQDFFGVRARLKKESKSFPKAHVVPPIVEKGVVRRKKDIVLINMGGLQNPFWSVDDTTAYARSMMHVLYRSIPATERIVIATSNAVAGRLKDVSVRSYSRQKMEALLPNVKYAFMTPGLGNIYDAARYDIPTVWLPPANDSQGQQADLLSSHGIFDGRVDWSDVGAHLNYRLSQKKVLRSITSAVRKMAKSVFAQDRLAAACVRERERVQERRTSACKGLLKKFGSGGAERVAEIVYDYAQEN